MSVYRQGGFYILRGDSYSGCALCAASSKYSRKRVFFLASAAPLRSALLAAVGGPRACREVMTCTPMPVTVMTSRCALHQTFGSPAPRLRNTSASRYSLRVSGVCRSASGRAKIKLSNRSTRKKDLLAKLFCEKERQKVKTWCSALPNTRAHLLAATQNPPYVVLQARERGRTLNPVAAPQRRGRWECPLPQNLPRIR